MTGLYVFFASLVVTLALCIYLDARAGDRHLAEANSCITTGGLPMQLRTGEVLCARVPK